MHHRGFTLVELSVVLVIIALLVGGVFAGQSLIQSARLKETIGDYDRYEKAIKEFQDKYQALPGDMNNAETIWGSDSSCPTTATTTTIHIATCNGNGDGRIGDSTTGGVLSTTYAYEWFRAWQELAAAGLIAGSFSGVKGASGTTDADIAVNVPRAPLGQNAGWTLHYYLYIATDVNMWGDQYGHVFALGADTTGITNGVILSPADAKAIDDKMDDGKPGRGNVRARRTGLEANCTVDTGNQDTTTYNTTGTTVYACSPIFLGNF